MSERIYVLKRWNRQMFTTRPKFWKEMKRRTDRSSSRAFENHLKISKPIPAQSDPAPQQLELF